MEKEIKALKEKFRKAKSPSELEAIDKEIEKLAASNQAEFENSMLASIKETNKEVEEIILRDKLESILPVISISYLTKEYFHKTPQWFYQRLNGNIVNGKQAKFSNAEIRTLSHALEDISNKIRQSVALL